jgi:phage terminase large subunit-like protein
VRQDQNENIMPAKKNSTGRIDGIVASIIAVSRAVAAANAPLAQILFV